MPHSPVVISVFDLEANKYGSMEEYALFLSRALGARGWKNVMVFVRSVKLEIMKDLVAAGATVEVMSKGGQPRCYRELRRILRKYRGDVVHYHFLEHFSLLPILGAMSRPRLQLFTDHFRQPQPIGFVTKTECLIWDRVIFRALGIQIVAISEHIRRTLIECYGMTPQRIRVVLNGINVERFKVGDSELAAQVRAELGVEQNTPMVVCASNLRPEKGIDDLLSAAKPVLAEVPKALFVIIGTGPMEQKLKDQAADLGLANSVRFTGPRSDVHRFMAAADIVVAHSVWQEPAGLVAIEGMAVGRPVVATRVGGIPEYLEDGVTGILVDPRSPDQLARALVQLLRSPAERDAMGKAGRARAEAKFSMDRWIGETVEIFAKALERP